MSQAIETERYIIRMKFHLASEFLRERDKQETEAINLKAQDQDLEKNINNENC